METKQSWYAAKCVFKHDRLSVEVDGSSIYEERIILVRADGFDEAISKAEVEAEEYANDLEGTEYTGYVMAFHLYEDELVDLSEIFSEMRESPLDTDEYLDQFYDTGMERSKT